MWQATTNVTDRIPEMMGRGHTEGTVEVRPTKVLQADNHLGRFAPSLAVSNACAACHRRPVVWTSASMLTASKTPSWQEPTRRSYILASSLRIGRSAQAVRHGGQRRRETESWLTWCWSGRSSFLAQLGRMLAAEHQDVRRTSGRNSDGWAFIAHVMKRAAWGVMLWGVALRAAPAAAQSAQVMPPASARVETSRVFPRFTLIELQYPQGVAVSAGAWVRPQGGDGIRPGLVADVEAGLSGASLDLGLGGSTSLEAEVEKARSFGVQVVLLRTWPWWSPWLPTSTTYAGVQIFGHAFAFRCSVGLLWGVDRSTSLTRTLIGGCGLGWP